MKVTSASSHPLNVVLRQMADIRPYEGNPRINDEGVQYVANSIKEFGIKQPIVIDKEGTIVAGHTRYAALKKLKWTAEVPCIMADDLTPEQVSAYRLADNKTAEFSDWDLPKLDAELTAIPSLDMSAFGFSAAGEGGMDYLSTLKGDEAMVEGTPADSFAVTLIFPRSSEQKVKEYIRDNGKETLVELILGEVNPNA